MNYIKFSSLKFYPKLFQDYVCNFDNLSLFFEYDFRSDKSFSNRISYLQNFSDYQRNAIADILIKQYENFSPSQKTLNNINKLRKLNSFAVITGQQIGVIGGPLYSLYKTIAAIKLATLLKEKFFSYNFLPVFWMPSDDSDLNEINLASVLDKENRFQRIFLFNNEVDYDKQLVGDISIVDSNSFFAKLQDLLRETEFTKNLIETLKSIYSNGKNLKTAFKELWMRLFDEDGLIIFDADDDEARKLLKPIYERELNNFLEHSKLLIRDSALLEDIYHAQVKIKPINLFIIEDGKRFSLEPDKNGFSLKGKKNFYPKSEFQKILDEKPQVFSPNVLLRPLCQDYLFPTLTYIAGPSEISYYAQIKNYYKAFNMQMPIVYPRPSATIVENSAKKIIDKYNIALTDFLSSKQSCVKTILNSLSEINPESIFNKYFKEAQNFYSSLKNEILLIDSALQNACENFKDKIVQNMEVLKKKTEQAYERKNEIAANQLEKLGSLLLPDDNLQERELSWIYFANKYGLDFYKICYDNISINIFEHQIIEL
jgi:bacillithiol biosynthesis cysteine-adding enzyme BshC